MQVHSFKYHRVKKEYLEFIEHCRVTKGVVISSKALEEATRDDEGAMYLNAAMGALAWDRGIIFDTLRPNRIVRPIINDFYIYDETEDA